MEKNSSQKESKFDDLIEYCGKIKTFLEVEIKFLVFSPIYREKKQSLYYLIGFIVYQKFRLQNIPICLLAIFWTFFLLEYFLENTTLNFFYYI